MTTLAALRTALRPFAEAAAVYAPHPGETLVLGGQNGAGRITAADFRRAADAINPPAEPGTPEDRA